MMSEKLKQKKGQNNQIKVEDELPIICQESARDILKILGSISKEECDYYKNLP